MTCAQAKVDAIHQPARVRRDCLRMGMPRPWLQSVFVALLILTVAPLCPAVSGPEGKVYLVEGTARSLLFPAYVTASSLDGRILRTTRTDREGHYEFTELPPQTIMLSSSRSGYYTLRAAGRNDAEVVLDCTAECSGAQLDFEMQRGAVLTGHIRDGLFEPLSQIRISAQRVAGATEDVLSPVQGTTDDQGKFRLAGLRPGTYTLTAQGIAPGARTGTTAIGVEVQAGELISGLSVTLGNGSVVPRPGNSGLTPANDESQEKPEGTFSGVVRSATTGETLRGVSITARRNASGTIFSSSATTGFAGEFRLNALPEGSYAVTIRKSGYRGLSGIRMSPGAPGMEGDTGSVFALLPSGAVSGRVLDPDGVPMPNADVRVYALRYEEGGVWAEFYSQANSNDLGEYRIYGLEAGKYLLQARHPAKETPAGEYYAGLAASFYPNTPAPSQAVPLQVDWGREVTGIDVGLSRTDAYSVSVSVWDMAEGEACVICSVVANHIDGATVVTLPSLAGESLEGRFQFEGLSPGDYTFFAHRPGGDEMVGREHVTIPKTTPEEVMLTIGVGQSVSGEFVLEDPPNSFRNDDWSVFLASTTLPPPWPIPGIGVESDLRFRVEDVPAETYDFHVTNLPPDAYLKTLRLGGRPWPGAKVEVPDESPVIGIEAVIAFDGAIIIGRVLRELTETAADVPVMARVALMAAGDRGTHVSMMTTQTDAAGSFQFVSVPPGRYTLRAMYPADTTDLLDPVMQLRFSAFAKIINLEPRGRVLVELQLPDLADQPVF